MARGTAGYASRSFKGPMLNLWTFVLLLRTAQTVVAFTYGDLMPESTKISVTPYIYGCMEGTTMCLIPPNWDEADPVDDYQLITGYYWVNIVIENDLRFSRQEAVLNNFKYKSVQNGSLFYCSSSNCNSGHINETMNIITVFLEEQLGLENVKEVCQNISETSQSAVSNSVIEAVEILKNDISGVARMCENAMNNSVIEAVEILKKYISVAAERCENAMNGSLQSIAHDLLKACNDTTSETEKICKGAFEEAEVCERGVSQAVKKCETCVLTNTGLYILIIVLQVITTVIVVLCIKCKTDTGPCQHKTHPI